MEIVPLPPQVEALLEMTGASPRLRAHLALVHDTATHLTERVSILWPHLTYDAEAVKMGAATHDIGKVIFPDEMTSFGRYHQAVGAGVLLDFGVPEQFVRYTRTHGRWRHEDDVTVEDLMVALADTLWSGRRDEMLEERSCAKIAQMCGIDPWRVSMRFYEMTESLAQGAVERLAWYDGIPA